MIKAMRIGRRILAPANCVNRIIGLSIFVVVIIGLSVIGFKAGYAAPQACVAGPHSGTITSDEEWCLADSPHLVNGILTVAGGTTLTVDPGVEIQFSPGTGGLYLIGTLHAEGTPIQPIVLTAQTSNWAGIIAIPGSHLQLGYCNVGYASGDGGHTSVSIYSGADVHMNHCRIHDMAGVGLKLQDNGLTGVFENLEIDHNSGSAVWQNTLNMNPTYSNLQIHNNGLDAVWIPYTEQNQDVVLDGSPAALNGAPIYLEGVLVLSGKTLTVAPGSVVKLKQGSGIFNLFGTLIAEGTSELPITLSAQAGNWAGILANGGSQLQLAYCDVGHASGDGSQTSISIYSGANAQIRHCRIHDMAGVGLKLQNNGLTGTFEDLEIDHNSGSAVWQNTLNMNLTYSNLRLHDNGLDAVFIVYTEQNQDVVLDGSPAALNGAPIYLEGVLVLSGKTLTVTPGSVVKMKAGSGGFYLLGTLIAEGASRLPITLTMQTSNWSGILATSGSHLRLAYCDVSHMAGDGGQTAIRVQAGSDVQIRNCLIHHSQANGLNIEATQISLKNIALVDNTLAGLWLANAAHVDGAHLTLARNASGVNITWDSTINLTNTIIAENVIGVNVANGASVSLVNTLWDSNATSIVGVVNEVGHIDGSAAFDTDGYHILPDSAAVQRGIPAGVDNDIDGDPRPSPAGTAPDIGADECLIMRYFDYYLPITLRD